MDLSGKLVTVFGGSGFIGGHVVDELLRAGARVRIAGRNAAKANRLRSQANLGQMQIVASDVTKPQSVARALTGADAAVYVIGSFTAMEATHVTGPRNVAEAAAAAGLEALVHVSAIGADAESASDYGRTKARGEAAVRGALPAASIVRPSIVFGRADKFVNMFGGLISRTPVVPVIGARARFQPVWVEDVARAIATILTTGEAGRTFELGGPEVISMLELNQRIAAAADRKVTFVEVPDAVAGVMALLPGGPISRDQLKMLKVPNVKSDAMPGLAELGISATPLGVLLPEWMVRYRHHGRFDRKTGIV